MKRSTVALGIAAVAVWSTGVFAQGRNFAGNWTVDSAKTQEAMVAAGGGAAGGEVVAMRGGGGGGGRGGAGGGAVVQTAVAGGEVRRVGGDAGAVTMAAGGGGARSGGGGGRGGGGAAGPTTIALDANTFTVGTASYKLDGTPTTTETPMGNQVSKATWKGDKLVIERSLQGPNGAIATTQTWYIEGEWLVRESSSPAPDGGAPRVSKTYFKRS